MDVGGFTTPNPNPPNAIHQNPKLEWRGSEVVYLKDRPVKDACSFDTSSHRKGRLYKARNGHWEQRDHEHSVHNRRQSLRASWVPAKARAVWTHLSEHKMAHACHLYVFALFAIKIFRLFALLWGDSRRTMLKHFSLAAVVIKAMTYFHTVCFTNLCHSVFIRKLRAEGLRKLQIN
jgi:hypothetical protein